MIIMRRLILAFVAIGLMAGGSVFAKAPDKVTPAAAKEKGCLSCHEGIEDIRDTASPMMAMIQAKGAPHGDAAGCVVCHGGNPQGLTKDEAHKGSPAALKNEGGPQLFYPDPGSVWIAENSCGQSGCHSGYAYRVERSLMNTEAGKIQGNLHTWGIDEVQNHKVPWGNYDVADTDGSVPQVGTDEYKAYMKEMMAAHKDQFPTELKMVPLPSVEEIEKDPKLAGFTYQRQECQRCHVAING
ncbi:MAG: cytochrome C, partial [Candidatus Sedimenticola endophacoides]